MLDPHPKRRSSASSKLFLLEEQQTKLTVDTHTQRCYGEMYFSLCLRVCDSHAGIVLATFHGVVTHIGDDDGGAALTSLPPDYPADSPSSYYFILFFHPPIGFLLRDSFPRPSSVPPTSFCASIILIDGATAQRERVHGARVIDHNPDSLFKKPFELLMDIELKFKFRNKATLSGGVSN